MTTPHDAIAAVPESGTPDRSLMQALLIERYVYVLDSVPAENDFDPTGTGTITLGITVQGVGEIFWYDSTDSTTSHDGVTCIVGANGERFKIDGTDYLVHSVLSFTLTDPPTELDSPPVDLGDAYLIPAGSSADWATKTDYIGLWTSRGFVYIAPKVGRLVYVEDEDTYYRYTDEGAWTQGFGSNALGDNSVPLSAVINFGYTVRVEDQTTNAPPSSAKGTAYIIGPSPTGDWAGQSGKIAIREAEGTGNVYVIYNPPVGARAYDKDQDKDFQWNGTIWRSAAGEFKITYQSFTANGTWTKPDDCFMIIVEVWGAGGNGGTGNTPGAGGGGAGGGYAQKTLLDAEVADSISVTAGTGTNTFSHTTPVSSTAGGNGAIDGTGGEGGQGSGGDINLKGQGGGTGSGTSGTEAQGGVGGSAPRGGGGGRGERDSNGQDGAAPGGGGSGSSQGTSGDGAIGEVLVTQYIRV